MNIRLAKKEDIDFIKELSDNNLLSSFSKEELLKFIIEEKTYYIFVIEENGLIGFLIVWLSDDNGQIIDLVIKENKRELGYAEKVLTYGIDYLIKKQVSLISLEVNVNNFKAINLYEKFNFKKERILKNYYKNEDGLLMMRKIK